MTNRPDNRVFGKRAEQHILILASGDRVRHMTVRPWMIALGACVAGAVTIGYLLATSYLVLRDDLIGATMARQARMQHEYEDRIAALRAQVDRVTSRQLLDQQVVEEKVDKLMEQQMALTSRHSRIGTLLDKAEEQGLQGADVPVPAFNPERKADAKGGIKAIESLMTGGKAGEAQPSALAYAPADETVADRADRMFSKVTLSLKTIEREQMTQLQQLTSAADDKAGAIEDILRGSGVNVESAEKTQMATATETEDAVGGPFIEPQPTDRFEASIDDLDVALKRLDAARGIATVLPFANPAPQKIITSRFGNRTDPFLGRLAMHSGIDFRFESGERVHCSGGGVVTVAGPSGGYGNMVEVDHGNGLATRYGHMQRILVKVGDKVDPGDVVGLAGSTGRSTGTHLHYEVRRNGQALDPMAFLNAGRRLLAYL
ncbi:M23 family metallopeptidase [Rhizobium sp. YJ-22]|uniref:M23 family metallopeptidase n=1 Tax=Rhizobium sp. YJ-22 TaxID=3037556 RepID=UPI002412E123|nr:M23 family metallopeptidase [Rhizobium sp. YJ-22]MDG3578600.1 M23 family metallopeptidase [Rhizobium sp. YJ-22]